MNTEQSVQGTVELVWFKSSYSGGDGGNCVEVATSPGVTHVRDSKDKAGGSSIVFASAAWAAFVGFAAGRA